MDLKIDLGVRKQLLDRASQEMNDMRSMTDNLLRENGALQFQLQQLPAPADNRPDDREVGPHVDNPEQIDGSAV